MYGKSGAMLPNTSADHTRFSLRKGSTAAAWDTVKGIEWNRLYVGRAGLQARVDATVKNPSAVDTAHPHFSSVAPTGLRYRKKIPGAGLRAALPEISIMTVMTMQTETTPCVAKIMESVTINSHLELQD